MKQSMNATIVDIDADASGLVLRQCPIRVHQNGKVGFKLHGDAEGWTIVVLATHEVFIRPGSGGSGGPPRRDVEFAGDDSGAIQITGPPRNRFPVSIIGIKNDAYFQATCSSPAGGLTGGPTMIVDQP